MGGGVRGVELDHAEERAAEVLELADGLTVARLVPEVAVEHLVTRRRGQRSKRHEQAVHILAGAVRSCTESEAGHARSAESGARSGSERARAGSAAVVSAASLATSCALSTSAFSNCDAMVAASLRTRVRERRHAGQGGALIERERASAAGDEECELQRSELVLVRVRAELPALRLCHAVSAAHAATGGSVPGGDTSAHDGGSDSASDSMHEAPLAPPSELPARSVRGSEGASAGAYRVRAARGRGGG